MIKLKLISYLLSLLLIFSPMAFATLSVRVYVPDDVTDPEVFGTLTGGGGNTYSLLIELPAGSDGTQSSNPVNIYVPGLDTSGMLANASLYSLNGSDRASFLPQFVTDDPPNSLLTIEQEVTITTNEPAQHFLHAAVANNAGSNDWRVIGINATAIGNGVSQLRRNISFNLTDFCDQSAAFNCNELAGSNTITGQVYYFLASSNLGIGAQINPTASGLNHGVYFNINVSTRVYDANLEVKTFEPIIGDGSISLSYQGSAVMNAVDRVIVLQHLDSNPVEKGFVGEYSTVKLFDNEYPSNLTGKILVEPLENNVAASLSVAFVDKYNYATRVSNIVTGTPIEILALLREQSCFFFTAGFQRKHYVTDRLQKFRSNVLMKFSLGREFVRFYYTIGPKYAPLVLDRPWLQMMIKGIGYSVVFVLDYGLHLLILLMSFISAAIPFLVWRRKREQSLA